LELLSIAPFSPGNAKFGFREYVFSALSNWLLNLQWSWARLRSRTCREDATLTFFPCHHILANFKRHYYFITNFFTALRFLFLRHVVSDFYERLEFHDFFRPFSIFPPTWCWKTSVKNRRLIYQLKRVSIKTIVCVCTAREKTIDRVI
jgi:hypothetical protein